MGGNAFTQMGHEAKRMDLETFTRVKNDIYNFLTSLGIEYLDIKSIKDKTDFGDLDVLVVENGIGVFEKIKENLDKIGLTEKLFIRSGFCSSALYEGKYQIDFIKTHDEYKEYHQMYLSHNDLGNLIGRCVKEGHFKHGHDGFFYTYYDGTRVKKDILISTDYREPLRLLGLSVEKFDEGFDSLEDMFKFVTDNKYFKASFYKLENLNNRNRVRDGKRKNYRAFLEYVQDLDDSTLEVPKYYDLYPFLKEEVSKIEAESKRINKLKEKFNGVFVMEWTGLKGKELGDFIGEFKKVHDDDYLTSLSELEVKELVLNFYNSLQ